MNSVLVASSNELHLNAFKEHPDYNSFRGRLRLVRVPYLLDHRREQGIYDAQITPQVRRHVAPHATFVAGLWAVLTRVRRSQPDRLEDSTLGRIAADLTPLEKAHLYADGTIPTRLSGDDSKVLKAGIEKVYRESESAPDYEGLTGASPREVRMILLDAAADPAHACLSPLAVLRRLELFCQRNDYEFLKESPDRGYQDHRGFIRQVRNEWLLRVDDEVRACSGLIDETQHVGLFDRYVMNVSFWVKSERIYNKLTGAYEDPDQDLMSSVERKLGVTKEADDFRRNLISNVAAYAIDHPGAGVDYLRLFPRHIGRLREAYFEERGEQVSDIITDVLALLAEGQSLDGERRVRAERTFATLCDRFGYNKDSAREALSELIRDRYPH
jgi:predicted Ser/Thr protein kinase